MTAVQADLQFVRPAANKLYFYEYDPPPGVPRFTAEFESRRVPIHDARESGVRSSLGAQGFAHRRQPTRTGDFYDAAEVQAVYYPEVEQLLKEVTGARSVVIFDHTVRGDIAASRNGATIRPPVQRVHNDYTPASGARRVRDLLARETADRLLRHRVLEINVWRPIRGPLQSWPLAVCDATSMHPDDLVACDLIYPDRVGEIHYARHSEGQRWYYYPDMAADEVLLLKCFDSDPVRGRTGVHAAFEHPHTPSDAPPRESIEVRAFAFFAPG